MSVQGDSFLGKDCLFAKSPLAEALFLTASPLFDMQSGLQR